MFYYQLKTIFYSTLFLFSHFAFRYDINNSQADFIHIYFLHVNTIGKFKVTKKNCSLTNKKKCFEMIIYK
jgi:hypothetical protein